MQSFFSIICFMNSNIILILPLQTKKNPWIHNDLGAEIPASVFDLNVKFESNPGLPFLLSKILHR